MKHPHKILFASLEFPFSILLRIVGGETEDEKMKYLFYHYLSVSSCGSWGVKRPLRQRWT
ncbi:MAG: hypothetical protein ANABAC_0667 [Anaerolineae bacterium]|nr:MAG: hypothetical protein ANABAC_0667 [Anaerolineae bacterium]